MGLMLHEIKAINATHRTTDPREAARRVDKVMRWGYYVIEFSPYHVRIQDAVDFWPTSGKWRDARGYKFEREGYGLATLNQYLRRRYPILEDA